MSSIFSRLLVADKQKATMKNCKGFRPELPGRALFAQIAGALLHRPTGFQVFAGSPEPEEQKKGLFLYMSGNLAPPLLIPTAIFFLRFMAAVSASFLPTMPRISSEIAI